MVTTVPAPTRGPTNGGLFTVLSFREGAERWENGVAWEGATCGTLDVSAGPGCPPDETPPAGWPITIDRSPGWVELDPAAHSLTVSGEYACAPLNVTAAEAEGYAVADLQLHEEATVEGWLWDSHLATAPRDATVLGLRLALGRAEAHIAREYGYRGVIHLPRYLVPLLGRSLDYSGQTLVTRHLRTPVVAGGGYPGTPGAAEFIVASPALVGYRSPVEVLDGAHQTTDWQHNNTLVLAQRSYLLGFDSCPLQGFTVDPAQP